jgi:hypothetical protein
VVKIPAELAERSEPIEGAAYRIESVQEVKTAVQNYSGFRVTLTPLKKGDNQKYATMLWTREVAGPTSKLGAFIKAFLEFFGDKEKALDTDNWVGHTIRIISWQPKRREVKVIE